MLPVTGVICRRKKRRGLWHSGETVVPLCAIGQLATRLQQMELEKWYENTGYALQYYTARAYTPLSSKDGRGEVSWDETQPIQDFPFHWAGFQFDGISMICTPYGAAWIPIVRTSMYIPYMLIVSLFMSNLRHHIVTKKEKKKKKQLVSRHLPATAGEALVLAVAVGVVLVRTVAPDVVFIVHFVGVLLRVVVGLDLVGLVQTLGLSELVGLGTGNTSQDLLGGGVADVLACRVKGTPVSQLRGYR